MQSARSQSRLSSFDSRQPRDGITQARVGSFEHRLAAPVQAVVEVEVARQFTPLPAPIPRHGPLPTWVTRPNYTTSGRSQRLEEQGSVLNRLPSELYAPGQSSPRPSHRLNYTPSSPLSSPIDGLGQPADNLFERSRDTIRAPAGQTSLAKVQSAHEAPVVTMHPASVPPTLITNTGRPVICNGSVSFQNCTFNSYSAPATSSTPAALPEKSRDLIKLAIGQRI